MTITPNDFAAYLKCTTKYWIRAVGENPTGNAYAEWIQDQNESYRADGLKRLLSAVPQHERAVAPAAADSLRNRASRSGSFATAPAGPSARRRDRASCL